MNLPYPFHFLHVGLVDIADVLLVTVLLYQLYKLLRGSVALNVALGGLSVYLVYLLVNVLGLGLLSSILGEVMDVGVLASVILFQQEIRRFLVNVGKVALEGGGVEVLSWQTLYFASRIDGRWKLTGFVGYMPFPLGRARTA